MKSTIKNIIKKYLWKIAFYNKIYGVGKKKNLLFIQNINNRIVKETLNIFTTHNEDGLLLEILSAINVSNRFFIDIGSNDCINSNCANLAFHHNWQGLFIDGDKEVLKRGEYIYKRYFKNNVVKFSFLNELIAEDSIDSFLNDTVGSKDIGLLSIDLDGNDYYIWNAIKTVKPLVVIIEVQIEKGIEEFIPPYQKNFLEYTGSLSNGASVMSMLQLGNAKGYELVAYNKGFFNLIFVRKDVVTANMKVLNPDEARQLISKL